MGSCDCETCKLRARVLQEVRDINDNLQELETLRDINDNLRKRVKELVTQTSTYSIQDKIERLQKEKDRQKVTIVKYQQRIRELEGKVGATFNTCVDENLKLRDRVKEADYCAVSQSGAIKVYKNLNRTLQERNLKLTQRVKELVGDRKILHNDRARDNEKLRAEVARLEYELREQSATSVKEIEAKLAADQICHKKRSRWLSDRNMELNSKLKIYQRKVKELREELWRWIDTED